VIEARRRRRKGDLYHVRIDLTVPGAEIVVRRDPPEDHVHEDVVVAVRDAFKAARRRLQDFARESRGQIKAHDEPPHGRVLRIFPDEGYGFLATADGREVYFHENAVLGGGFPRLRVGEEVRFLEEEGEKGPQATSVRRVARKRALR
jgi:cold shock CspA family protein